MPRITALHMLRSTMTTVSAPANSSFRGSIPHPTQPLCTLRVRPYRRLTQHSLPGDLLGLTWAGLAPADRASFTWRLPSFDHLISDRAGLWDRTGPRQRKIRSMSSRGRKAELTLIRVQDEEAAVAAMFESLTGRKPTETEMREVKQTLAQPQQGRRGRRHPSSAQ